MSITLNRLLIASAWMLSANGVLAAEVIDDKNWVTHPGVLEPGIYSQITFATGLLSVLIIPLLAVYTASRRSANGHISD